MISPGPFRLVGFDHDGDSRCAQCGAGIRKVYTVESAHGERFDIGSECVKHLNDKKLEETMSTTNKFRVTESSMDGTCGIGIGGGSSMLTLAAARKFAKRHKAGHSWMVLRIENMFDGTVVERV